MIIVRKAGKREQTRINVSIRVNPWLLIHKQAIFPFFFSINILPKAVKVIAYLSKAIY